MTAGLSPHPIHYAPESDDAGICGATGFLAESLEHVTCEECREIQCGERRGLVAFANGFTPGGGAHL